MHVASMAKAEFFVKHYGAALASPGGPRAKVLEVGSKSYNAQETYRPLFDPAQFEYTGLDVEAGPNVDIVPANGYVWQEIPSGTFDICVSGQTFEHNPLFWVTFSEIARVLKPGGYVFIVAPGAGEVHRYPYDCWRFYPDAWIGLCATTGMTLVESYFESDVAAYVVPGGRWRDSAVIARKPLMDAEAGAALDRRLEILAEPYAQAGFKLNPPQTKLGPCFADYERSSLKKFRSRRVRGVLNHLRGRPTARLLRSRALNGG